MGKARDLANVGSVASSGLQFRNRIINGDMRIDQRYGGASVTPPNTGYTVDRWFVYQAQNASKFSVQQNAGSVTPPPGFTHYLGVTSLSAYSIGSTDVYAINQAVEGLNVADFNWGTANAVPATLSFWVRSSLSGTFGGVVRSKGSDHSFPFTYSISASNTWEQKTITILGPTSGTFATNNTASFELSFALGVGSTFTGAPGSWLSGSTRYGATGATSVVGTNGATFYITGVQLEKGPQATPFEFVDQQVQLARCQRYYEVGAIFNYWSSITFAIVGMRYSVTKRANPTVTVDANVSYSGGASGTQYSATGSDQNQLHVNNPNSGNIGCNWRASAEL